MFDFLGVEELFREVSQKLVQNKKNIQKAPISATLTGKAQSKLKRKDRKRSNVFLFEARLILIGNVGTDSSQPAINVQGNDKGDVINDSCC